MKMHFVLGYSPSYACVFPVVDGCIISDLGKIEAMVFL